MYVCVYVCVCMCVSMYAYVCVCVFMCAYRRPYSVRVSVTFSIPLLSFLLSSSLLVTIYTNSFDMATVGMNSRLLLILVAVLEIFNSLYYICLLNVHCVILSVISLFT